jgi:Response regulator containing CheY-like receiver, AAA-type ATPase, and DNA-binding domains
MKQDMNDILAIDDEQVILDAVGKICSLENLSVDTAIDVRSALLKLEKNNYRLIICDIMMPEIDGFEFLNELNIKKITTPVIMATGYSTVENAVKSLYKGAIDFIPKPFTADELLNSVIRGNRYTEIMKNAEADNSSLIYIPCPAKYFRLGYSAWVTVEHDGSALAGVTDLFLKIIETVEEISFLNIDEEIIQGISFCQITSKDGLVHDVLSPVSGRIIGRNDTLLNSKSLIEKDPFFEGWIYRIIPSDIDYDLKNLTSCSSDRM